MAYCRKPIKDDNMAYDILRLYLNIRTDYEY